MLKAAVDVFYKAEKAKAVCILFEAWASREVFGIHTAHLESIAPYEPGAFYKRELPCILAVLRQVHLSLLDAIVVDGYVHLDDRGRKGLGAHLYEALQEKLPVIGVAKTRFHQNGDHVMSVYRGKSRNPLFVSAAGIELTEAANVVQAMAGDDRIPDLLRFLDQKTREEGDPLSE